MTLAKLPTKNLAEFTDKVLQLDENEIVKHFGASFIEAETLVPALLAYTMLARHFELPHVYVCETNLRDGLLHDMAVGGSWTAEFRNQSVRSAVSLGRKFGFDEMHSRNVAEISRKLFDQLQPDHQLDSRYEVILYLAALLHEIGMLINVRSNHKHALYVIRNSDLFGLSKNELLLVGLVARYYRRASPQSSHPEYGVMPREERVAVSKMASILRIAIALADTRSGRIREIECEREGKRLVINVPGVEDVFAGANCDAAKRGAISRRVRDAGFAAPWKIVTGRNYRKTKMAAVRYTGSLHIKSIINPPWKDYE